MKMKNKNPSKWKITSNPKLVTYEYKTKIWAIFRPHFLSFRLCFSSTDTSENLRDIKLRLEYTKRLIQYIAHIHSSRTSSWWYILVSIHTHTTIKINVQVATQRGLRRYKIACCYVLWSHPTFAFGLRDIFFRFLHFFRSSSSQFQFALIFFSFLYTTSEYELDLAMYPRH